MKQPRSKKISLLYKKEAGWQSKAGGITVKLPFVFDSAADYCARQ